MNDQAASEITAACYRNILAGQEISIALHHAKVNWLQNKQRPAQEYLPYYWDALIYMGYDKKVNLQPAHNRMIDYGQIAALIIAAILGIYYLLKVKKKSISPVSVS
ncbi:CHAT domain protein [compost metagenome]